MTGETVRRSRDPLRVLAAAGIVASGVCIVTLLYAIGLTNRSATKRDFIQYWAAGQQVAHGGNPYDPRAILLLEKSAGLLGNSPKVTFSPPIILLLAWPLGYLSAKIGLILWSLASLGCLGVSAAMLVQLRGRPKSRIHLIAYVFPPALASLMAGQIGIFLLFDVVIFLWLYKSRPWLAGAGLVLTVLKPHLFLLCAVVLLLWSVHRREFRVIAGFLVALAASCALTLCLAPQVWTQYAQMMQSTRVMDVYLPTVGVTMRFLIDRHARWLEFLPEAAGCIWVVWYFRAHRDRWDWRSHGLLLLLVSVVCTPYAWYSDQTILWPAILAGLYQAEKSLRALVLFGLIAGAGLACALAHVQMPSPLYLWTAPAWLGWYLYAMRRRVGHDIPTANLAT